MHARLKGPCDIYISSRLVILIVYYKVADYKVLVSVCVCVGGTTLTWKDLMKVHRRVRIPSPLLSSLTNRITLNSRKKVIEMRELSSGFCGGEVKS